MYQMKQTKYMACNGGNDEKEKCNLEIGKQKKQRVIMKVNA